MTAQNSVLIRAYARLLSGIAKGEKGAQAVASWLQRQSARLSRDPESQIANGWLIFYLALVFAVLIFVVGAVAEWREGSGQGVLAVDILWHVVWVLYSLVQVALVILLVIWGYRRFRDRRGG